MEFCLMDLIFLISRQVCSPTSRLFQDRTSRRLEKQRYSHELHAADDHSAIQLVSCRKTSDVNVSGFGITFAENGVSASLLVELELGAAASALLKVSSKYSRQKQERIGRSKIWHHTPKWQRTTNWNIFSCEKVGMGTRNIPLRA